MNKQLSRVPILLLMILVTFFTAFALDVNRASAAPGGCSTYIDRGYCVPGYISSETWWTPAPQHSVGKAVWYAPYLMNATAEWRGQNLDGFVDGVAMMSPADIGQVVWLKRPNLAWEGPFLVVDVSSTIHMWTTITKNEEVVEVGFNTALSWGLVEGDANNYSINAYMVRDVEVYKGLHPPFESSEPVDYVEWFKNDVLAWGNGEYRRWSTDDIEIFNYEQYQGVLAAYLQIDFTVLYRAKQVKTFAIPESSQEETGEPTHVLDSSISIKDAHHYTQEYLQTVRVVDEVDWELNCEDENPYNGFVFIDYCVPGVISKESWLMDYPAHTIGVATFYAPGVMDKVVANRGMSLKGYVDGIVTMTCGNVGDSAYIRRPGLGWEGPYLVVDCGGPHGVWAFTQYKLHIEVDYDRWMLWDSTTGHQNIEVCIGNRDNCNGSPVSWWKYWLQHAEWLLPIEGELIVPDA